MNGADLTKAWLDANEPSSTGPSGDLFYGPNREPIVIPKLMGGFESLGGKVPDAKTGFQDIANLVGRNKTLDVIDVATQKSSQWSLGKWADYISEYREEAQPEASSSTSASSSPPQGKKAYQQRNKVYNVISLEISGTALARKVRPPKLVSEIDWVDKYWPDVPGKRKARRLYHRKAEDGEDEEDEEERAKQVEESIKEEEMLAEQGRADWPKVQLYCLMGMKGSWTVSLPLACNRRFVN
jgi:F-box/leucine-rich repeat protein 10/11